MSQSAHTASAASGQGLSTPEFDAREVELFGEKDAQAVTVIGKMLVLFFFYSLIVMACVGYWTFSKMGASHPEAHSTGAHHGADHSADDE
ncbi:MAG: hypothetical protein NT069_30430 [Planctomycetota bacterium]|nr:hypothetical protein [Planctomycetota bacterium]